MEAATASAVARLSTPGSGLNRLRGDRRLAERFRAGDESAFAVLHERHRHRLLAICIGVLGSYEDAQDALQNALASAAASLRQRTPDEVRAWLARVARNAAIDMARARRPTAALHDDAPAPDAGPAGRAREREEMTELVASLRRLPEHQRTALVMRELGGCSYAEIGQALEVDETAVRGLIARARLSLRAELEASELVCATVREDIAHQPDARRRSAIVRRHLRACDGCRAFDTALRADARALRGLGPPAGGLGILGIASLLRLTRPVALGGVVAQGIAGTQVLQTVAVCAVCVTAAGGVRELAEEPATQRPRPAAPSSVPPSAYTATASTTSGAVGAATVGATTERSRTPEQRRRLRHDGAWAGGPLDESFLPERGAPGPRRFNPRGDRLGGPRGETGPGQLGPQSDAHPEGGSPEGGRLGGGGSPDGGGPGGDALRRENRFAGAGGGPGDGGAYDGATGDRPLGPGPAPAPYKAPAPESAPAWSVDAGPAAP